MFIDEIVDELQNRIRIESERHGINIIEMEIRDRPMDDEIALFMHYEYSGKEMIRSFFPLKEIILGLSTMSKSSNPLYTRPEFIKIDISG